MKIADVISSLETFLGGLTWTSDDGGGTTSFSDVFTYPNWDYNDGYPFACILDENTVSKPLTNQHVEANTTIAVYICVNYSVVEGDNDDAKKGEAYLRLREAYDTLKVQLLKNTTRTTIGVDWNWNLSFTDDDIDDFNLIRRRIAIQVKELIERQ